MLEKLEKAKEEKRRRLEATSTATSTGTFTAQACFLALEFHSQNTHARMGIRNRRTYVMRAWVLETDVRI